MRALFLLTLLSAGCADQPSRVKGELFENGQPASLPPGAMPSVVFRPLDSNGRPSETVIHKAVVSPAGSFEYVTGGGELSPGSYQFSLELTGSTRDKYPHLQPATSRKRIDLKPGVNLLRIDLASKD